MDIFYYWKDYVADRDAGRIGFFRSKRSKLAELAAEAVDYIWAFKTPKGLKGEVQLIARLRCVEAPSKGFAPVAGEYYAHYDPHHPKSVRFTNSSAPEAIEATTRWVNKHFHDAIAGNFQGELGQRALRGDLLRELVRLADSLEAVPFIEPEAVKGTP